LALAALAAMSAAPAWAKGSGRDLLAYYAGFERIDNLFDASGAAQLPDGRLIVVQDSRTLPVSILRREGERYIAETWTGESLSGRSGGKISQLADLEEVVLSSDGFVYALSSHVDKDGAPSRQSFARFRLNGERLEEAGVVSGLKSALVTAHPALAVAAGIQDTDTTFNIEGFTFDRTGKRALFGFRAPVPDRKAVVIAIENPTALFIEGAVPQVGEVALLDLGGDGIRSMAWLPRLNGYLIAGRTHSPTGNGPFRLWFWSGDPKAKPQSVFIDSLKSLRRPEGIAPVVVNGEERILLVSDEGNRNEGKASQIALIAYDRLRIVP
jgi:hypothetical protein